MCRAVYFDPRSRFVCPSCLAKPFLIPNWAIKEERLCTCAGVSVFYLKLELPSVSPAALHERSVDKVIRVDELARTINMSTSSFRKAFREVMHMPPLQYAKLIKLNRAQTLIREGKNASEAGYLVGYNSPAQFSREYKRYFGFVPSAT